MKNKYMEKAIRDGECIDLSDNEMTPDGKYYIVDDFEDGIDYCNAKTEEWIWSIGKNLKTGEIHASHQADIAGRPDYKLLWLR